MNVVTLQPLHLSTMISPKKYISPFKPHEITIKSPSKRSNPSYVWLPGFFPWSFWGHKNEEKQTCNVGPPGANAKLGPLITPMKHYGLDDTYNYNSMGFRETNKHPMGISSAPDHNFMASKLGWLHHPSQPAIWTQLGSSFHVKKGGKIVNDWKHQPEKGDSFQFRG